MGYAALNLLPASRRRILRRFRPRYAVPVCHHVTYAFGTERGDKLPPRPRALRIVGHADDGSGIEALIVAVDGTMVRPDGKIFHITLSHAEGRAPVESNALIARAGWRKLMSMPVAAQPRWNATRAVGDGLSEGHRLV